MAVSCTVFVGHISTDRPHGVFEFAELPRVGESIMLPDAGPNPPANHTVHEVVHIPGRNGSLPSVALIVVAAGHPVPQWASGEPGLAAAANMRRDLERRDGRRA
jgi:hypothetical protein